MGEPGTGGILERGERQAGSPDSDGVARVSHGLVEVLKMDVLAGWVAAVGPTPSAAHWTQVIATRPP